MRLGALPARWTAPLEQRMARWVRRRQGEDRLPVTLQRRRLYILPTRAGSGFAVLLLAMLVAGLNYANSLALLLTFVLVSLISKDFAVPRYGYGTMVGVTMIIGRALPALLGGPARWMRIAFVATLVVLSLHGLRPEVDFLQVKAGWLSPRMNVTASRYYKNGSDTLKIYPSDGYHFVIVDWVDLTLPIFGRRLSNEVIGSIPSDKLGPGCHALADYLAKDPAIVFIDQGDKTKACKRTCEINWGWYCAGWKIEPL